MPVLAATNQESRTGTIGYQRAGCKGSIWGHDPVKRCSGIFAMHELNIVSLPGTEQESIGAEQVTTNGCQECWCPDEECPSNKEHWNAGLVY